MAFDRQTGALRFDRAGAKNQRRNIQRQHQQCQQRAAATHANGQRRANRANQRQQRRAQQQGQRQHAQRRRIQRELQAEQRRQQHQRQAAEQPVGDDLAGHQQGKRRRRQRQLFQRAVQMIAGEQARQPEQGRQQRRHPENTRRDFLQQRRFRPDAERKQADGDDEKKDRGQHLALAPHRQQQIAPQGGEQRIHRRNSLPPGSGNG